MNCVRWGIIGCGNVAETKSAAAFQEAKGAELRAVMRRDHAKATAFAKTFGVPVVHATTEALLSDPEIDAVYVATPPESHARLAQQVATSGKHCYLEKPMAMNVLECLNTQNAFTKSGTRLFTAFYRRCLPGYLKIKEWLQDQRIGDPCLIQLSRYQPVRARWAPDHIPWRFDPTLSRGGLFSDVASHTLDLIDFWFGPMATVSGLAANQRGETLVEDAVVLHFKTASGIQGTGSWNFNGFEKRERNEIIGTRGMIVFSSDPAEPIELVTLEHTETFSPQNPSPIQLPMIEAVTEAIRTGTPGPSDGENGIRVQRMMDAVLD